MASSFRRMSSDLFFLLLVILTGMAVPATSAAQLTLTASLPVGAVGVAYSGGVSASGGVAPYDYAVTDGTLPSGVALDGTTGIISGVPQAAGKFTCVISASDKNGVHGNQRVNFTFKGESISVRISPTSASLASGGTQSFSALVTGTSNTAVTWSATAGKISGTGLFTAPTTSSTISAVVTATSVAQASKHASANITVTSGSAGPTITTTSIPSALAGTSYAADLSASGGTLPYVWSVASGTLPGGVLLDNSSGLLSGTTAQMGSFTFVTKVTDAANRSASQTLTLTVSSASGSFDGPAELPRVFLKTSTANTPAPGVSRYVPAGGDLQAVLDATNCGDTILLQAGASFIGNYHLHHRFCDDAHWIIIRTSAANSSLPPEGTRMTPCYAGVASLPGRPTFHCSSPSKVLARIMSKGIGSVGPISLNAGANHYRLIGVELTRPVGSGWVFALVNPAGVADHIILDRVWAHGSAKDDTTRGIYLSGVTNAAIIDSYMNDFHCTSITGACTDAQTIAGGSGNSPMGPYKIVNNFLEASGESILFGGGPATTTPTDIEIRRNHLFKPIQWMWGTRGFVGGLSGQPFIVKNHLELKNAQRVLFEANILENNWGGFTQYGFSILLTARPNMLPNTGINRCSNCQVTDVTIRYNTISHVGAGLELATPLSNGAQALFAGRYSLHDITIDDVSGAAYRGKGTLLLVANEWPKNVLNSITINHITGFTDPNAHVLSLKNLLSNPAMWAFSFTNNIVVTADFPVWSTGGGPTNCANSLIPVVSIPTCFHGYAFSSNALIGSPAADPPSKWPKGNFFPPDAATVQFVNYNNANGGNYQLLPSSPYKNKASDGKDLGADVAAIQSATSGVY